MGRGVSIFCPLSTTTSFAVAVNFTESNKGLVMTFSGNRSQAKCFDVSWLSDYPSEHEYLFLQNHEPVQIVNIKDIDQNGTEFKLMLNSFKAFDAMMSEQHCSL